jgi:hypothetical protein
MRGVDGDVVLVRPGWVRRDGMCSDVHEGGDGYGGDER